MPHNLQSFLLVDASGLFIIVLIVLLLVAAVVTSGVIRSRYASLEQEIARNPDAAGVFRSNVLNRVLGETLAARSTHPHEVNTQAIVENAFQAELGGLLIGERFVKASTGLLIILGLVGTFYGLTRSIGELVSLVSGDFADTSEVTQSLTRGLTEALSGMSVAFTTSLVGIAAAIVMTLVGVFANVADRRTSVMLRLEAYLDNLSARTTSAGAVATGTPGFSSPMDMSSHVAGFAQSVARLEASVVRFESGLNQFSDTSRDLHEFNRHLRDNVQRLSLTFADLSNNLQHQVRELKSGGK